MSTGEESFVPVEEAEVKSAMPNEELDTPTKASSMKEGAEDSTPSGKRFPESSDLRLQARQTQDGGLGPYRTRRLDTMGGRKAQDRLV